MAAWSFSYLLSLLCGIYYPISILPWPLPEIARCIPLTYFLEFFRTYYGYKGGFENGLAWGFGLSVVYLVLGAVLFSFVLRRAKRIGTLIKLSE